jgi:tetratricopeptide (TPR) repeat protein
MNDKPIIDQRGQMVQGPQTNIDKATAPVFSGNVGAVSIDYSEKPEKPPIPRQIPLPPADFIGREEELQELRGVFERDSAIIGLRGMGGVGKTALAFALAEGLKDRFPDGQLFISMQGTSPKPLAPAEAMAQVIRSFAPALRLPESVEELANLYRSVLDGKCVLLLLDNALNDGQVRSLLPPAKCSLIVTSRLKFKLPGMVLKDLEVLKLDKAVELLHNTAGMDSSDGSSQKMGAWEDLARLCGCLPVALRAAGSFLANTPDSSLEQYARELQDEKKRLKLIGKEGVDEDLDLKLSLSYSHLAPETTRVFRELSVFPSDFDAKAEEVICQDDSHRLLSELLRWSLVEYQRPSLEDEGRYHLHDLVRLFAAGQLVGAGGEDARNDAQQRHAEYFKGVLSSATEIYKNGDALSGLSRFDLERVNIESVWAWAKRNLARSTTAASICNTFLNWPLLHELRMHPRELISRLETALAAAQQLKDKSMEAVHLGNLGNAYADLGETRKAIDYYEQALAIAREIGDRRGEGNALGSLGSAYYLLGETRKAIDYYEQALVIIREIGYRMGEGNVLDNLGIAYCLLGETRKAIEYHEQALAIAREIGDRRGEGNALGSLGNAYYHLFETRKAVDYYEQQLKITQEIGDRRGEGNSLWNLSLALHELDERSEAIKRCESALEIFEQIESPGVARVRQKLAEWR